ncbi:GTP cyclohydrolase N terminal-domain-containing protein [Flammula alnicola]|nr:GTP cyclohydrolase N terminal-domain-containing protein [Flammula alnicola]
MPVSDAILMQILGQLEAIQVTQQRMQAKLDSLNIQNVTISPLEPKPGQGISAGGAPGGTTVSAPSTPPRTTLVNAAPAVERMTGGLTDKEREKLLYPGRINLTSPHSLHWGAASASERGPQRNAMGAHSSSYSIYRALSIAMATPRPTHKPGCSNAQPPIVSFDPWGHFIEELGSDVRPSIAVSKAHLKMSELGDSARRGELEVDRSIVIRSAPLRNVDGSLSDSEPGMEVYFSKAAVEPVWYLPRITERLGSCSLRSESLLRRALFEDTGGKYPELITCPDIKVFLPLLSKELTLRVHDECNGSDPRLTYAMEEYTKGAQKEGRALGEVTKYLVYNLCKCGGDSADKYFKSTEMIAGVKDMRFDALMPDVLHWLGIKKVDKMVSISNMKYDAIMKSGITIWKPYDIPDHLIPPDSHAEIDAKIAAGYFSSGKQVTSRRRAGLGRRRNIDVLTSRMN